ncbi:MAG: potassium channel family protein [Thermomicrobiales bacterium]|nr:potassium channel family protein [Thermomicrobiales bacterium]
MFRAPLVALRSRPIALQPLPATQTPTGSPARRWWAPETRAAASAALERYAQAPLTLIAVLMAPLVLAPYELTLSPLAQSLVVGAGYVLWGVFTIVLAAQLLLNPNRRDYLRRHWSDAVIVLLPAAQPLLLGRTFRVWWGLAAGARAVIGFRRLISRRGLLYLLVAAFLVVAIAADLVFEAERAYSAATIRTYGDALWWAVATVTSVGYGDRYPLTPTGRTIGIGLMILGIGLFGLLTANLATLFVEAEENKLDRQLSDLDSRLRRIEDALGKQAHRQRAAADRAMRVARRARTRRRKGKDAPTGKKDKDTAGKRGPAFAARAHRPEIAPVARDPEAPRERDRAERTHDRALRADRHSPSERIA